MQILKIKQKQHSTYSRTVTSSLAVVENLEQKFPQGDTEDLQSFLAA